MTPSTIDRPRAVKLANSLFGYAPRTLLRHSDPNWYSIPDFRQEFTGLWDLLDHILERFDINPVEIVPSVLDRPTAVEMIDALLCCGPTLREEHGELSERYRMFGFIVNNAMERLNVQQADLSKPAQQEHFLMQDYILGPDY